MKRTEVKTNGFKEGDKMLFGWGVKGEEFDFELFGTTIAAFVERKGKTYAITRAEFEEQCLGDDMLENDTEFFATASDALNFANQNGCSVMFNCSCWTMDD